jgi:hypothetical protein
MRGPRDPSVRGYLHFFIPDLILCQLVHKGRLAIWRMSSIEALIFVAAVVVMVALLVAR